MDIMKWLLSGEVSIQYQTHRDLLGEDKLELKNRIQKEGFGKRLLDKRKEVASGLAPAERELLDKVMNTFISFFGQPGNQAVGKVNTFLDRVFDEMAKKFKDTGKEGDKQQSTTPSKDDENFDIED